jgi:hypothetical protein
MGLQNGTSPLAPKKPTPTMAAPAAPQAPQQTGIAGWSNPPPGSAPPANPGSIWSSLKPQPATSMQPARNFQSPLGGTTPGVSNGLSAFNATPMAPSAPGASQAPGEGFGPGFGETYGKQHVGQYDTPTMLEQFAQSQLNGTNPYYDRIRQQGMDAINQQMIARGHGNSGGALAALGNFTGQLGAQQFQDMGNLLGAGSTMGLNRMQQGQNTANSIQGMQQGRIGQQWGQLSDLAHLGAGTVGGFYGQGGQLSGDAAMSGINAGANAAQLQGQGQQANSQFGWDAIKGAFGLGK